MIYDYIIVGGGIAGLYANFLLSKKYNTLLLEKNNYFGGRSYEMDFHGTNIKLGAGIMADHNKHLLKLLKKLNIKVNSFMSDFNIMLNYDFDMTKAICSIVSKYEQEKNNIKNLSMKQFLIKYFGTKFAKEFIENCEYADFINSDVEYFIKYYDIYDMSHEQYKVLIINWYDLVSKLVLENCINNTTVTNIIKDDNKYIINTDTNYTYTTKKIIFATTLAPLIKLTKNIVKVNYNDYIGTTPFIRIYTYHKNGYNNSSNNNLGHYNFVDNELQKIIKINDKVLMSSYSDSKNALYWKKYVDKNKDIQIKAVSNKLKKYNIKNIDDIVIAYWEEGVHYYKPNPKLSLTKRINLLSRPDKNIYVVGEIISKKQGWVEGCIESVERCLKRLI
jgi:protoporphyrinogen oxidase